MTTRVRLPDGSYVQVPTEDPKAAARAAQKHWANRQAQKPRSTSETIGDFFGDVVDNVLPNMGDEIAATGAAVRATFKGQSPSKAFVRRQREFKREQERYDRDHPSAAWASTLAGIGAGTVLPAGKALRGATMGQKARQGAKVGAAYGAVAGAGEGEGLDAGRRATNAAYGAGVGAAAGTALPIAARGAGNAGRWARTNIPGADAVARNIGRVPRAITRRRAGPPGPSAGEAQGNRMLAEQMNQGNIAEGLGQPGVPSSPQAIAAEVERRQQLGVPAIVGDVTENMRGLTEYASRGMGPGQSLVRQALDRRKASEGPRVRQHVRDTLPTTGDPIQFVETAKRDARAAAAPLYAEAYARPVFRSQEMQGIEQTPAFRSALPQAYDNIRNQIDPATGRPMSPQEMGFRQMNADPNGLPPNVPYFNHPEHGFIAVENGLSTEGYDQVARAMADNGRAASNVNPVTGRVDSTTNSVHINQRTADLRRLLGEQNEPYRRAVQGFGDDMTQVRAFEQGQEVGKLTGHEVNAQRQALPDIAQNTWATGAGTAMADEASQYAARFPNGATANRVRQMLGDDVKQQAISEMSGNTGGTRQLLDRLEYEQQAHINWQGVNGNSKTAQRQQLDNDLDTSAGVPTTKMGVVTRLIDFVAARANPQYQQDVKRRIAEVVTASGARDVQEVMAAIDRQADLDREFADLLHRSGIATTAAYGMNVEPVEPTPEP